jgi:hypothetical protein
MVQGRRIKYDRDETFDFLDIAAGGLPAQGSERYDPSDEE